MLNFIESRSGLQSVISLIDDTTAAGRTGSLLATDQQPASSTSSAESVNAANHNAPPSTYLSTSATSRTRSSLAASTTAVATVRASPALSDALIEIRPAPDAITRNSTCATFAVNVR